VPKRSTTSGAPLALEFIERVDDVAQKMEAIGNLDCGRRAQAHSLSDPMAAVACDDLGTGMRSQPTRQSSGFVVRQNINRSSNRQIND
jgi:hypothetical protein